MKKSQRSGAPGPSTPVGVLAERAAEALRQERFKEATELFKLAIRQDPRPEWKELLADAYSGRARTMAAKKMFKEAAMVLENTIAADGTVRDPRLYVTCLIRDGQQPKAAAYLLRSFGNGGVLPTTERAVLEDLAAALLVGVPQLPEDSPRRAVPTVSLARSCRGVAGGAAGLGQWRIGGGDGPPAQPDIASFRLQAGPPATQVPHRDTA